MLALLLLCHVVGALKTETSNKASSQSSISRYTPSSLPIYPLDFQDNWQASRPIPVDINYSVPQYGPGDLTSYLEKLSNDAGVLTTKLQEREWQENNIKGAQDREELLLPYIRERIAYAHLR